MSVNAKFSADFTSFSRAVEKAEVELRGLETEAGKVEKSLNKMVDSFSGRKIIQDANLAAEAVNRIGGASKLTESEQARLNRTVTEALAKYKALGIEVPPHLQKLAHETRGVSSEVAKVQGSVTGATASLGKMASSLGIAFSAGMVVNFAKGVFAAAGQIDDLSKKLGVSSEAVQRLKYAAEQTGTTIETVEGALAKMNDKLASGDKSTINALKMAGLSFDDIRRMRPEDAFNAIAEAIGRVEDPMQRARLAMDLFGKAGADLLPMIVDGTLAASKAIDVMSDDTVKRLADAEDAWGRLWNKVIVVSGEFIGRTLAMRDAVSQLNAEQQASYQALVRSGGVDRQGRNAEQFLKSTTRRDINLPAVSDSDRRRKAVEDALAAAKAITAEEAARKKHEAAIEAEAKALKALSDQIIGLTKIQDAQRLSRAIAFNDARGFLNMEESERKKANAAIFDAIKAYNNLGIVVPREMRKAFEVTLDLRDVTSQLPKVIGAAETDFSKFGTSVKHDLAEINQLLPLMGLKIHEIVGPGGLGKFVGAWDLLPPKIQKANSGIGDLAQSLSNLSNISGGAFGNMVRDLSTVVASIDAAQKGMDSFKKGKKDGGIEGFAGMASGILGIATAAISAGKALGSLLGIGETAYEKRMRAAAEETKKLRAEAEQLHGSAANLRMAFSYVGIQIDEAFKSRDPEWIKKVLAEGTEKLAAFNGKLSDMAGRAAGAGIALDSSMAPYIQRAKDAGIVTDELAQKLLGMTSSNRMEWKDMQSLAEKYGVSLSVLGPTFQQQKLTGTASEIIDAFERLVGNGADFNGVLAGMQDEINEVVIQSMKFGTQIPENMRPWIAKLIESGKLLDASGEKITDIDTLKFGPTVKSDIEKLADAIKELIRHLEQGLGGAIDRINGRRVRIPVSYELEGEFPGPGPRPPSPSLQFSTAPGGSSSAAPAGMSAPSSVVVQQPLQLMLERQVLGEVMAQIVLNR